MIPAVIGLLLYVPLSLTDHFLQEYCMSAQHLIASDFDGTFTVSLEENIQAVQSWRADGNRFGIVTGRNPALWQVLQNRGFATDYMLCLNGAVCIVDGKVVFSEENAPALIPGFVRTLAQAGAQHASLHTTAFSRELSLGDEWERALPAFCDGVDAFAQISCVCKSDEDAVRIAELLNTRYRGVLSAYANGRAIDTVKSRISKATGVRRTAELFGIPEKNVHTVGDNHNDLVMIEAFDGFAVNNAVDAVKAHARHQVTTVADMIRLLMHSAATD